MSQSFDVHGTSSSRVHTPQGKRRLSPVPSSSNLASAKKRRRLSVYSQASVDLSRHLEFQTESDYDIDAKTTNADRFIPSRPKPQIPLTTTPRSKRFAQVLGLADDRVLNFSEAVSTTPDTKVDGLLRKSASQLLTSPAPESKLSAFYMRAKYRNPIMVLDTPAVPRNALDSPVSWSCKDRIAVGCDQNVFWQDLETRNVQTLCSSRVLSNIINVEWASERHSELLAFGTQLGAVQIWDVVKGEQTFHDVSTVSAAVGAMCWSGSVLTVARHDGVITSYDCRVRDPVNQIIGQQETVHGLRWRSDGQYLAAGHGSGAVHVWDSRSGKDALTGDKKGRKLLHRGRVKALSWCPWQSELLATGSVFPEGTIRIWNINSVSTTQSPPQPVQQIDLATSVMSLHWSPHCKELLSTHGSSWLKPTAEQPLPTTLTPIIGPFTNSLTVFDYPGGKYISTPASSRVVSDSCLSPDGTNAFTLSAEDEMLKLWKVWGHRSELPKQTSFGKFTIR